MALDAEHFLVAVGVLVLAGFLAQLGFRKWRLPDVLVLIGLGVLLGPVWHFVDIDVFRAISPLVGTVAIVMILFDGGLEMRVSELKHGAARGTGLALVVFTATVLLCAGVGMLVLELSAQKSLLLGMAFGGAGAVIVLPMIQQLGVRPESFTVVALEAAVSDVLVIVGIFAMSEALTAPTGGAESFARDLFVVFALALVLGVAAGFLWSRVLGSPTVAGYGYVLTLAALFLLHGVTERFEASGPIAVLAFGLVVGNSRKAKEFVVKTSHGQMRKVKTDHAGEAVFSETLAGFHQEAVFLIRSFFFFGLGVVLELGIFKEPRFLLGGLLLALAVVAGRVWGVMLMMRRKDVPPWDRAAVAMMFPLGLAAAALSQVPWQRFQIEGTENFASYAAVAIVLTNLFCSVAVFVASRPAVRTRIDGKARGPPAPLLRRPKATDPVRPPPRAPPGSMR